MSAVIDLTTSTFKLTSTPAGTITISAQGVKKSLNFVTGTVVNQYSNTVAQLVAVIVTQFGKVATRFSSDPITGDIDLVNFQTFHNNNLNAKIGIYLGETDSVLSVCKKIVESVGAQLFVNRDGKLQILRFGEPYGTSTTITTDDMLYDTFYISKRFDIVASHKIGYAKNWTVQDSLLTAIPDEQKDIFSKEWLNVVYTNNTVKTDYLLDQDPPQKDTFLISRSAALAEATRLTNFYSQQRTIYTFTGKSKLLALKLGQPVLLKYPRFGLDSGVSGQVVSLISNWTKGTVEVGVLI